MPAATDERREDGERDAGGRGADDEVTAARCDAVAETGSRQRAR